MHSCLPEVEVMLTVRVCCMQVDTKPASDIIAGAVARAASQSTIHPLDTLKVRMQAPGGLKGPLSKFGKLVPPPGAPSRA